MAAHGYITHAAYNRRMTVLMCAAYMVAFQLIAVFVLTWFLLMFDHENTVLSNPLGYFIVYGFPVAIVTGAVFYWLYTGHADTVAKALDVKLVDRIDEPRFVAIAEEQCTALGVRFPRFGVIEAAEPNALTVGESSTHGLIAVTRGLLDTLDDDELAAVLAHEASHIRQGDTKVLAANHALMRTAVILQTHNALRIEDWRQLFIPLCLPAMLPVFLVSGAATQFSLRLARFARRGLKLSRDHIADGEAVRVTHFPEALVTALQKINGRGGFPGSERVETLLFDGRTDHEGGTHPTAKDRVLDIGRLAGDLLDEKRSRRDTRSAPKAQGLTFGGNFKTPEGKRVAAAQPDLPPEEPSLAMLLLFFTNNKKFWQWQNASIDAYEWREDDRRNFFGLTPKLVLPTIAATLMVFALHWPADGDMQKLANQMRPMAIVEMARQVNSGPFCSGPSYPDGKCKKSR